MSSLNFRKDNRTTQIFANNIEDYTERESKWSEALLIDFNENDISCKKLEHGVDNTGKLIENKLKNYNADKIFVFIKKDGSEEEKKIEIKTCPEYCKNFMTFKVFSLKSCLKQHADIIVPKLDNYHLFFRKGIEWMLKNLPCQIYKGFSPNDPAVRITINQLSELIDLGYVIKTNWKAKAQDYIMQNKDVLTRDKVK